MQLLDILERRLAQEDSPFRMQLLREDLARLRRLTALAPDAPDAADFRKAGMRIGWTPGDLRTHELAGPLAALLDAVYAYRAGARHPEQEARIIAAWEDMHRARMERLVGCLSTPVPRPND